MVYNNKMFVFNMLRNLVQNSLTISYVGTETINFYYILYYPLTTYLIYFLFKF
jgi:hypothetical protein